MPVAVAGGAGAGLRCGGIGTVARGEWPMGLP